MTPGRKFQGCETLEKDLRGGHFPDCKLNIFISGMRLNTENLRVTSFCQEFKDPSWINKKVDQEDNIKIENAILNKAKKLKLQSS